MCHKETATEEPRELSFCKDSLFTEGVPAEVRFKALNLKTLALILIEGPQLRVNVFEMCD